MSETVPVISRTVPALPRIVTVMSRIVPACPRQCQWCPEQWPSMCRMTRSPGQIPNITNLCPGYDQDFWSYSRHRKFMSGIWPGFLVIFQTVRNMTSNSGHCPDIATWCQEYNKKFWSYFGRWHYSGQYWYPEQCQGSSGDLIRENDSFQTS